MVDVRESARRVTGRWTHRLRSVPILALNVHTACNCRCVMCDIWKANDQNRTIGVDELTGHVAAIRRLHVRRVMLTGGEPLLHRNLWTLCDMLRAEGIKLTLVTTGLLIDRHVDDLAARIDELVISIDGPAGSARRHSSCPRWIRPARARPWPVAQSPSATTHRRALRGAAGQSCAARGDGRRDAGRGSGLSLVSSG